jgi:hypothetical protein
MRTRGMCCLLLVAAGGLLIPAGCPQPSSASLLTGQWELVPDQGFDGPLTNLFITFDAKDQLSEVSYTFTNGATVTWRHPDSTASVDGSTLHVACTVGGNGFAFDGTLNSTTAPASADGTHTLDLEMGDLSVSMPQGPATLVRQ